MLPRWVCVLVENFVELPSPGRFGVGFAAVCSPGLTAISPPAPPRQRLLFRIFWRTVGDPSGKPHPSARGLSAPRGHSAHPGSFSDSVHSAGRLPAPPSLYLSRPTPSREAIPWNRPELIRPSHSPHLVHRRHRGCPARRCCSAVRPSILGPTSSFGSTCPVICRSARRPKTVCPAIWIPALHHLHPVSTRATMTACHCPSWKSLLRRCLACPPRRRRRLGFSS